MKFEKLVMDNFMRYKGRNEINFSTDKKNNVTVVLGDNTSGKTTIASAIRWGLYGEVLWNRKKESQNYNLLNNDVLVLMDPNTKASVSVEIILVNEEKRYKIYREIMYTRNYPAFTVKELYQTQKIYIGDLLKPEELGIEIEKDEIENRINDWFPRYLSSYFLFDGEKWNDPIMSGVKDNIKESVHKLTGIAAVQKAMYHLKDMGRNSVITKMKQKVSGSGAIYDNLKADIDRNLYRIEKIKEEMQTIEKNIDRFEQKVEEIEEFLSTNNSTEELQKKSKHLKSLLEVQQRNVSIHYKNVINDFSKKGYQHLAEPMMDLTINMLKSVNLERRDIPYMHQTTIDYLLEKGECICGHKIEKDSEAYKKLLEQKQFLPPADIGSLLGAFEKKADSIKRENKEFVTSIGDEIDELVKEEREYEKQYNHWIRLEQEMDSSIDFIEKRKLLRQYHNECKMEGIALGRKKEEKEELEKKNKTIEGELTALEAKTQQNRKWNERIEIADYLYEKLRVDFKKQERKLFMKLNEGIQRNFQKMFNATDKVIKLDENYNIKMYYKTNIGYEEEKNLSEGEKIARNFAFIVTIMEFSKEKRIAGDQEIDMMPIVLDGPFSKLSEENIKLISDVLPQIADQVIIFMLEKDWKHTGLNDAVGKRYQIQKDSKDSSASIRRYEE